MKLWSGDLFPSSASVFVFIAYMSLFVNQGKNVCISSLECIMQGAILDDIPRFLDKFTKCLVLLGETSSRLTPNTVVYRGEASGV